jgi:hypothetical protein|tara:strand:- start:321 stop:602 length:282 start_codon:yes stop_codon:yes gene_type:complete
MVVTLFLILLQPQEEVVVVGVQVHLRLETQVALVVEEAMGLVLVVLEMVEEKVIMVEPLLLVEEEAVEEGLVQLALMLLPIQEVMAVMVRLIP